MGYRILADVNGGEYTECILETPEFHVAIMVAMMVGETGSFDDKTVRVEEFLTEGENAGKWVKIWPVE